MKRILNIQEYTTQDFDRAVRLSVLDENGHNLQGIITVEQIDDIKLDLFEQNKCCVNEETKAAPRYFVYNPMHEGKPQKIYDDYNKALYDAKDVAKKYSSCNVYVLEIKAEIKRTRIVHETITENDNLTGECSFEDIPF